MNKFYKEESGFALLFTVFIIALATILVMDFSLQIRSFQRSSRAYTEGLQANYILKSSVNLAKAILEAPKPESFNDTDSLHDWWAAIASAPTLPIIEGFSAEVRLQIVDENGKINLNSIDQGAGNNQTVPNPASPGNFWSTALRDLFSLLGFQRNQYPDSSFRTLGNVAYNAADQVAIIQDWIDADGESFRSQSFDGQGIESAADKSWFYNRRLRALSELTLVPGITLARLQRMAPFIKVSNLGSNSSAININTAPYEVLIAIGFSQSDVAQIMRQRQSAPYNQALLSALIASNPELARYTTVKSNEFSVFARVKMGSKTSWARAIITTQPLPPVRKASIKSIEFY